MVCVCLYTCINVFCGNNWDGFTLALSLRNSDGKFNQKKCGMKNEKLSTVVCFSVCVLEIWPSQHKGNQCSSTDRWTWL